MSLASFAGALAEAGIAQHTSIQNGTLSDTLIQYAEFTGKSRMFTPIGVRPFIFSPIALHY